MRTHGFTLPELLITLAVVCILLLSSQTIGSVLAKQQLTGSARDLASTLRFARSKAVITQSGVTVLATDGNWSNGWRVFLDPNRNAQLDGNEESLTNRSSPLKLTVSGNSPVASYVHYSAQGFPELISGGFQAGSITLCSPDPALKPLKMILSSSGRIRTEEQKNASCSAAREP